MALLMTTRFLALALLALLTARADAAPNGLSVFPAKVELHGPRAEQRLGVLGQRELTRSAVYASANPKVATVGSDGIVRPVGDGETTVSIEADGKKVSVPVLV